MSRNRLKSALKAASKSVARGVNAVSVSGPHKTRVLTYHSIGRRDHEMNVTPESFQEQMQWLSENATVISLGDAVAAKEGVAITFDDGFRDNLTNAAPILNAYSFPATVFVVPGRAGGFLDHELPTEDARLMTWEEILELKGLGVTIGGHTMNHARLSSLSEAAQESEIIDSTRLLEEHLGEAIEAFAYPFGSAMDYDPVSVQCVRRANYSYAVSNRYGPVSSSSSRWEIPRIWIDRSDTMETFQQKVRGDLDALSMMDSYVGIRLRRIVNRLMGTS
ncbi:MAG: polysaccharide deacetylase family protein [Candidatus Hydrogenedentota bacterium]